MRPRVNVITLAVDDLVRARQLYVDRLGWPVRDEVEGEVIFITLSPALVLSLWNRSGFTSEVGEAAPASRSPIVLAHNVPTQSEVDEVVATFDAAGGSIVTAATHQPWGGYSAYVADPEGYRWEIAYNPTPMGDALMLGSSV